MVAQFLQGIYKKDKTVLCVVIYKIISLKTHLKNVLPCHTEVLQVFTEQKGTAFDKYIIIPHSKLF